MNMKCSEVNKKDTWVNLTISDSNKHSFTMKYPIEDDLLDVEKIEHGKKST